MSTTLIETPAKVTDHEITLAVVVQFVSNKIAIINLLVDWLLSRCKPELINAMRCDASSNKITVYYFLDPSC